MIQELDNVVLNADVPEHGLKSGDIGTIVMMHDNDKGYEVEFTTLDGETIAVITAMAEQVRPIQHGEIAHARAIAAA
jgi:hypothetical protein